MFCYVLIVCVFAWQLSQSFRYFAKITTYLLCYLISATLAIPFMLPIGPNPENAILIGRIMRVLTSWTRLEYRIRGGELLETEEPCVLLLNHQSSLDVLGYFAIIPKNGVGMMKKALLYLGPLGLANYLMGTVFVERGNREQTQKVMDKLVAEIKKKKLKLLVCPEGTRNHGPGMLPFKKGSFHIAVQAQIPIIPIVFSSYRPFYNRSERRFELGGKIIVQILPKIPTTGLTAENVTQLSESTRKAMLDTFIEISCEAENWYKDSK